MRGTLSAFIGILCVMLAGFVHGASRFSNDPELTLAATWGLLAAGAIGVVGAGVAIGIQLARRP